MSDPMKYRTKEELEEYRQRDTIEAVRHTILTNNMATEDDLAAIDEKIKARVLEAVEFAENSPYPEASELYEDVYVQTDYPYIHD
jgi:pyruvate dehydrogenase E1 component alpha subunit